MRTYCSTLLTVEHILTNCCHYQSIREKYYLYSDLCNIFKVIPLHSLQKLTCITNLELSQARYNLFCAKSAIKPEPANQPNPGVK